MIKLVKDDAVKYLDDESRLVQVLISQGWVAESKRTDDEKEQPKRTTNRKK